MLTHQYRAAMSLLRDCTAYDDVVVCVLDPSDRIAAGLLKSLGKEAEAQQAIALGAVRAEIPTIVMVLSLEFVVAGVRKRWPSIANRMVAPVDSVLARKGSVELPLIRAICLADGGISYTVLLVDLSSSVQKPRWSVGNVDDDPTALPQAIVTIVEMHGEEIRAAINEARPDGRKQMVLVAEREVNGRSAYQIVVDETMKIADGLRDTEPELVRHISQRLDVGLIMVLFVLRDDTMYAMPMKLESVLS